MKKFWFFLAVCIIAACTIGLGFSFCHLIGIEVEPVSWGVGYATATVSLGIVGLLAGGGNGH